MNYLTRSAVCEKLKLGVRQSYRVIGTTESGLISSTDLLIMLNKCGKGIGDSIEDIPSDLATEKEIADELKIPVGKIRLWTRRTKDVCPHFRINKTTSRFPRSLFCNWLDRKSRIRSSQ